MSCVCIHMFIYKCVCMLYICILCRYIHTRPHLTQICRDFIPHKNIIIIHTINGKGDGCRAASQGESSHRNSLRFVHCAHQLLSVPVGWRMVKSHSNKQCRCVSHTGSPGLFSCLLYALLSLVVNGIVKIAVVCPEQNIWLCFFFRN